MSLAPRVRFCPAPSGWLHVGGARTALYNWLHARRHGGTFVMRVEDTDATRATRESMRGMLEAMHWLGLEWDEGPGPDGEGTIGGYGPYVQSERLALHQAVARALLAAGHAYEAFETPEELAAMRAAQQERGESPAYKSGHRDLTEAQRQAFRDEGREPVVRVRTPDEGTIAFTDLVRGEVAFDWKDLGDFVILRADGTPTYQLANVVDDVAQGITLISRGEDLLSATPRQLLMIDLLTRDGLIDACLEEVGYPARPTTDAGVPAYAHLPLLVGEDRKPLSKRHGSVAIAEFRAQGFLPEVLLNFLALCGWSYDGVTEKFTVPELIEKFSFDRVSRNPAYFDVAKLRSLNGDRIKELDVAELAERLVPAFQREGLIGDPPAAEDVELVHRFAPLLQERSQTLADAVSLVAFAFRDHVEWDDKAVAKWLKAPAGDVLDLALPLLEELDEWTAEAIMDVFEALKESLGVGLGKVMQPVRVVVTGTAVSPPLPETLAVLERGLVLERIREGRARAA